MIVFNFKTNKFVSVQNLTLFFNAKTDAVRFDGLIKRCLQHVLKLKYKLNHPFDLNNHSHAIFGWLQEMKRKLNQDFGKSFNKMIDYYSQNTDKERLSKNLTQFFKDNYEHKGAVTVADIDYSLNLLKELFPLQTFEPVKRRLSGIY